MNELIIEILKRRGGGEPTAYIARCIEGTYPKITTGDMLKRLFRLEKKGLVKRLNKNIHGGMTYLWTAV